MPHIIRTFNVSHLLLRFWIRQAFPGYLSGKSRTGEALNQPGGYLALRFARFSPVTSETSASDHCPVFFKVP